MLNEIIKTLENDFQVTIGLEHPNGKKEEVYVAITKIWNYYPDDRYCDEYGQPCNSIEFSPIQIINEDTTSNRFEELSDEIFNDSYVYVSEYDKIDTIKYDTYQLIIDELISYEIQEGFLGELFTHSQYPNGWTTFKWCKYDEYEDIFLNVMRRIIFYNTAIEEAKKIELNFVIKEKSYTEWEYEELVKFINEYAERFTEYINGLKFSILPTEWEEIED